MLHNARDLETELAWFAQVIDTRFKLYFGQESAYEAVTDIEPPDLSDSDSPYARLVRHYDLSFIERLALVLSLAPHIRPQMLDIFFTKNATFDRRFSEFGGVFHTTRSGFIPTRETLAFLAAGNDLQIRFELRALFTGDHVFARHNILHDSEDGLQISEDMLNLFTTGQQTAPTFSADFPAQHIETALSWDDLVLHPGTRRQIEDIETWLQHGNTLLHDWGMAAKLRPGYRSLFYGPPGTGKTITACLLGKSTDHAVYKIDLSLVVSKYIGETEKNLAKVFDQAEHKGWILFFDEADALFGKRSETKDAHDRYANQEVAFLLQRVETFDGVAILASNRRENIDEAFARRFESIIYFPMPRPEERLRLWREGFSPQTQLEPGLNLENIAEEYTLAGGAIMNVIRYASMQALQCSRTLIAADDVLQGIRRELAKEGKAT